MTDQEIEPVESSSGAEAPEQPAAMETPAAAETNDDVESVVDVETPAVVEESPESPAEDSEEEEVEKDERKRRLLLLLLLLLLVCLCCCCGLIFRYWMNPQPLPDILAPQVNVCYEPTYKFSINNVAGPVAVAGSPDDQLIYVAESDGERLVKVFDRDGNLLSSFAPPGTDRANREPKYMAVSPIDGRVYLVDRTSGAIDIYDANAVFVDAIIGQHLTLTKYLTSKGLPATGITHYEGINKIITYNGGQTVKVELPKDEPQWAPLGLRFTKTGDLIYTDKTTDFHSVHIISAADLAAPLSAFNPTIKSFGSQGSGNDQFDFPQTVVLDAAGNYYVSDGNNARITVWTPDFKYKTFFGFGSALNGALNLPRGTWMTDKGCLHVADAVGSLIRVYNVSGVEPTLAFEIGGYGIAEGQFNYPVDVYIDGTGRLYVADRANNRVQVWSY